MINKKKELLSLRKQTLSLSADQLKEKAVDPTGTTAKHSHGSDYSLKSCSPAELFSASSDESNLNNICNIQF